MTQFEYACFISYRNSRHVEGLISSFARELATALEQYLDAHLIEDIEKTDNDYMVFLDEHIIENGDFLPRILGKGICKSLCWIVVFTPNYLGGSLWCASELSTMLQIEADRFNRLNVAVPPKRFIIPVVLRGKHEDVPDALRSIIFEQDFRKFLLSHKNIGQHDYWAPIVDELASTIAARQRLIRAYENNPVNLCDNCDACAVVDVTNEDGRKIIESFVRQTLPAISSTSEMPIS